MSAINLFLYLGNIKIPSGLCQHFQPFREKGQLPQCFVQKSFKGITVATDLNVKEFKVWSTSPLYDRVMNQSRFY